MKSYSKANYASATEMLKNGDRSEAKKLFALILDSDPNHAAANYEMGLLTADDRKTQSSLVFFQRALQADPSNTLYWTSHIKTLISFDNTNEAESILKVLREKSPEEDAFIDLQKLIEARKKHKPTDEQIQRLINLYTQGQYSNLVINATNLLRKFSDSATLYNIQGAAYTALNQYDTAVDSLEKAVKIKPSYAEAYNNLGNALKGRGEPDKAIVNFKLAIGINPKFAEAFNNMGVSLFSKGMLDAAIEKYEEAIQIKSDYAEAYFNLGTALRNKGEIENSLKNFEEAIRIRPRYAEAYNNMGNILKDKGNYAAAINSYQTALEIKVDYAEAYINIGSTLEVLGDTEGAYENFQRAITIDPKLAAVHYNMGTILYNKGDLKLAIVHYNETVKLEPNHGKANHLLCALRGENTKTAPRVYVEDLFDKYALGFESSLVGDLEYRIPKLIRNVILNNLMGSLPSSVLDLGCGTGLVGEEIKDLCPRIEGVDLSKSMLRIAQEKNIYAQLTHADIVDFLSTKSLNFSLLIAADLFIYVGDLTEVFHQIKSKSTCGGKLLFSTEHTKKNGFHLEQSGRYSHSKLYIEKLCEKFDYDLCYFEEVPLRKDKTDVIAGALYLLNF
ncbi:MAG: tetratricopeptide repeat protein [Gammaproteobacteria bacterium]|nr:tetratricopeptide repeat protein [Gammaproteobacteria bacterium]